MPELLGISPSGARNESTTATRGTTVVTDGDKRFVKIICNVLFATSFLQVVAGAYAFSLATGQYQTRRGSWWAGILPIIMFIFCHCFWNDYADTDKVFGIAALSIIVSIAGAAVDAGSLGMNLNFGWCTGPTNHDIWWVNGNKNDIYQAIGLSYCYNEDFKQYNKDSTITLADYKPPESVCVCNVQLTPSSKSMECFPRFEMTGANSCAKLDAYGLVLAYTTASNVLTILLGAAVAYMCWKSKVRGALAAAEVAK